MLLLWNCSTTVSLTLSVRGCECTTSCMLMLGNISKTKWTLNLLHSNIKIMVEQQQQIEDWARTALTLVVARISRSTWRQQLPAPLQRRSCCFLLLQLNNERCSTPEDGSPVEWAAHRRHPAFRCCFHRSLKCADRKHVDTHGTWEIRRR